MTDVPTGRRFEAWRPTFDLIAAAAMLVLAFVGIAASDVSGGGSQTYWSLLAIVFGLICMGLDWVHEPRGTAWWKAALKTALHWVGVLFAIGSSTTSSTPAGSPMPTPASSTARSWRSGPSPRACIPTGGWC